jgi:hypothetical protein
MSGQSLDKAELKKRKEANALRNAVLPLLEPGEKNYTSDILEELKSKRARVMEGVRVVKVSYKRRMVEIPVGDLPQAYKSMVEEWQKFGSIVAGSDSKGEYIILVAGYERRAKR